MSRGAYGRGRELGQEDDHQHRDAGDGGPRTQPPPKPRNAPCCRDRAIDRQLVVRAELGEIHQFQTPPNVIAATMRGARWACHVAATLAHAGRPSSADQGWSSSRFGLASEDGMLGGAAGGAAGGGTIGTGGTRRHRPPRSHLELATLRLERLPARPAKGEGPAAAIRAMSEEPSLVVTRGYLKIVREEPEELNHGSCCGDAAEGHQKRSLRAGELRCRVEFGAEYNRQHGDAGQHRRPYEPAPVADDPRQDQETGASL